MYLENVKSFFKKMNIRTVVFVYIILMCVTPIAPRLTSMYLTTYFYMIVVAVSFLFTFLSCRLHKIKEYIIFILPFITYQMIAMLTNKNPDILLAGYQVLLFLFPACLGFYLVTHNFFVQLHSVVLVLAFSVTCMTTIVGCMANPDAARTLATTVSSQDVLAIFYEMQNIGGYAFVYSTVLLYPFVIIAFKMRKLHFLFVIGFTAVVAFMVIQASYTYAMLLMLVSTLLFFIGRDITPKRFFKLLIGFVLIVLLFRVTIAAILSSIGNMIGNEAMVDKINAAFLGTEAVDNFDDNRSELYMYSFNMFLRSPLFGTLFGGRRVTGGHAFILDNLALYGLVGAALMILMYTGIFRTFIKPFRGKPCYVMVLWTFIQPIILSTINTGMWLNNLCLYTPILLCAIFGNDVFLNVVRPQPVPEIPVNVLQSRDY